MKIKEIFYMKKQLQGISLILFGLMLMMFLMIDPWLPIVDDGLTEVAFWVGLIFGIVGLVFSFKKDKE